MITYPIDIFSWVGCGGSITHNRLKEHRNDIVIFSKSTETPGEATYCFNVAGMSKGINFYARSYSLSSGGAMIFNFEGGGSFAKTGNFRPLYCISVTDLINVPVHSNMEFKKDLSKLTLNDLY